MHYVVTGANRGIGLEFTRQLLARGDAVVAVCRDPAAATALNALAFDGSPRLRVLACDVGDDASVEALGRALTGEAVDVLINNAGVGGDWSGLSKMDVPRALATYSVNALGPLRVTRALLDSLKRGAGKRVVHISSGMGSIADNSSGGAYGYRMSKAALNMASKGLSVDLADDKIISVVINPGWVQTDMGGVGAPVRAEDSVRAMLGRIDGLTLKHSGRFLNWRGDDYAW